MGSYDPVARTVHWLTALLAVSVVGLGWAILGAARASVGRDLLLFLHRSIGLTTLAVVAFRLIWRIGHPPPSLPEGFPRVEALAAHTSHALLYVLFLVMPLSGYLSAAAAGHPVSFFGLFPIPPLMPEDNRLSASAIAVHLVAQFLVYALVTLHVAAALTHWLVRRNGIFERMLPRRRPL